MMRAYASCDQLSTSTAAISGMGLRKDMFSIGTRPGKVIVVYDGRRWPVVRCGSVYVSADDSARRVTQSAVTCTTVAEKKRRAGKYTVAVGTSHGHVQAFLGDSDNVLDTLDRCQAEDKCLMLIKRPKESARKMLKSHSLTQMSVSDPQLYRQFNGLQLTQVHQHAQTVSPPPHQDDQMDTKSTSSNNSTEGTAEPCRRYNSVKDSNRLLKQQQPPQYAASFGTRRPTDYHRGSDVQSSAASDVYQYLPRRTREPIRRDLRYSSIPEDEDQEINNNNKGSDHSPPCQSHNTSSRGHSLSHNQSPSHASPNRHNHRQGQQQQTRSPNYDARARNGHALNSQGERGSKMVATHDPGSLEVDARSQSMSSVSSGLTTFSLVGQRKADSMPSVSLSSGTPPQHQPQCRVQQTPRQGQGGGDPHWDSTRSPVRSHNRYMPNGHPPRPREGGQVTPGYVSGSGLQNSGHQSSAHVSPNRHHRPYPTSSSSSDHHHHQYLKNGEVEPQRGSQYNGHAYERNGSDSLQNVLSPLRIRTNMPPTTVCENSERLKRFTEVMRSRMSDSSCGDVSTTSSTVSQTPTTPHTPSSRHSSLTDNGWDSEVSTLLEVRVGDPESSPSRKPSSSDQDAKKKGQCCENERRKDRGPSCRDGNVTTNPPCPSQQETPSLSGDQHSDGGQTSFTSHSHSSTMDSGYTTNTEGDCDSSVNNNQLSPPYPPPPPSCPHPVQTPHVHVHAEPYRPVPMPRNLFPTTTRKCGSTAHHRDGGSTQQQQQAHHLSPGHAVHPEEKSSVKTNPCSQPKGPGPAASQCSGNPGVDPHQHGVGDWKPACDSATSFRSLDFPPGAGGVQTDASAGSSGDDLVVKPQAARSGNCAEEPTPQCRGVSNNSANKPDTHHSGGETGSSSSSLTESKTPSSLASSQPPESSSNSVITVPGHWNYNNANNVNVLNNNNPNPSGGAFHSSPRSHPRPQVKTTPVPTLFQLSQCYDLCSARLATPAALSAAGSLLTLTTVQVTLPADSGSAAQSSPQGHCARIGGPGSAFRPVRTGSSTQTLELTAVDSVDDQCRQHVTVGELQSGDVLLEVNGWQCMGHDTADIQALLDTLQEVTLVLARKRQETTHTRVQELEGSVHKLEEEVERLSEDLSQKDAQLQELSSMLPWTRDKQTGETTLILQSDDGAIVIGENEFVV